MTYQADPTTQPINIKTHAIDIAIASPLVILEVVISLFSGVGKITFLEYKLVIFLNLPDRQIRSDIWYRDVNC